MNILIGGYSRGNFLDEDGAVREVNQFRPHEVEGLELISLTEELDRLLNFESFLRVARTNNYKMLYA